MPKISNVSGKKVLKIATLFGFIFVRQKGSHIILRKNNQILIIPNHKKLKIGTLLQIIKTMGITKEEFEKLK